MTEIKLNVELVRMMISMIMMIILVMRIMMMIRIIMMMVIGNHNGSNT